MRRRPLRQRVVRGVRRRVLDLRSRFGRPSADAGDRGSAEGDRRMSVVFTGGTGRSGTTITAKLIAADPAWVMIPFEAKFIAEDGGLCDLALGRTTFQEFGPRLRRRWFAISPKKGLDTITEWPAVEVALDRLGGDLAADSWRACRRFVHALFDPVAAAAGASGWVEMNPGNVLRAHHLQQMFPRMRLVHAYRDGRDVACSVVPLRWGPDDLDDALDWWGTRLERAFASVARVRDGRAMNVQLEDLILRDRESEHRRLVDFLGLAGSAAVRTFFDEEVTEARAHIGRWRSEVPEGRREAFEAHHERIASRLAVARYPYAPLAAEEALVTAG